VGKRSTAEKKKRNTEREREKANVWTREKHSTRRIKGLKERINAPEVAI
jgi:hypothetical protein